jgi:hypothetical protein
MRRYPAGETAPLDYTDRHTVSPTMTAYTETDEHDDPEFLAWVEAVIRGVRKTIKTDQTYVVKIDKWFGRRWLGFSGKSLGALSVHKRRLTVPPFVPSRVRSVRKFWRARVQPGAFPRVHRWQQSSQNLQRHMDQVLPGANPYWYSGGTRNLDRGCLMAYVHTPEEHWPWYIELRRDPIWRVANCIGIGPAELEVFYKRGLTRA